jgi:hypothetical protein
MWYFFPQIHEVDGFGNNLKRGLNQILLHVKWKKERKSLRILVHVGDMLEQPIA